MLVVGVGVTPQVLQPFSLMIGLVYPKPSPKPDFTQYQPQLAFYVYSLSPSSNQPPSPHHCTGNPCIRGDFVDESYPF